MAETAFETALAGLYEASPPYADAEAFVAALTARLDRDARRRSRPRSA